MSEQILDHSEVLNNQIIDLYGALLLDSNLIFAIILAWAVTHFIKQAPFIAKIKPVSRRKYMIRVISVMVGFGSVVFFKWGMVDSSPDHVIKFAMMVAFTHPILYKVITSILSKLAPSIADSLRTKP